jgi:hypothetical protein
VDDYRVTVHFYPLRGVKPDDYAADAVTPGVIHLAT